VRCKVGSVIDRIIGVWSVVQVQLCVLSCKKLGRLFDRTIDLEMGVEHRGRMAEGNGNLYVITRPEVCSR
jgi:hypothetical protein